MNRMPVIICGGHFAPAIAVVEYLLKRKDIEIYYAGRKFSQESQKTGSIEYREIRKKNIRFIEINTGKLNRFLSVSTFTSLLKLPAGFYQSYLYLKNIRPALVISFGSYVALPMGVVAGFLGIPVITHEQTSVMGLSNRIICFFSKYICTAFPVTAKVPWTRKTINTGMPVRQSVLNPGKTGLTDFGNRKLPIIYVTGGSQGSSAINSLIKDIVPELLKNYRLLHVCGESNQKSDYHRLSRIRKILEKNIRQNYFLIPLLDYNLTGEAMENSSLVISRSGANTVAELLILNKKAILIPLPNSAAKEQMLNAEFMKNAGLATVVFQDRIKPNMLLKIIGEMSSGNNSSQSNVPHRFPKDGLTNFVRVIEKILDA